MNIEEIRKEMTREEFLKDCEKSTFTKYSISCPKELELKNSPCINKSCLECWQNAIKDIKFKGENEMNKDMWNRFLKSEVAVNCQTKDEAREFLGYCDNQGIVWFGGERLVNSIIWHHKEKTCYAIDKDNIIKKGMLHCYKEYYEEKGIEIIAYKQLITPSAKEECTLAEEKKTYTFKEILNMLNKSLLKEGERTVLVSSKQAATGCIYNFKEISNDEIKEYEPFEIYEEEKAFVKDDEKEYTIQKLLEMEDGTIAVDEDGTRYKVVDESEDEQECKMLWMIENGEYAHLSSIWLKTKFKLVNQDKEVPFLEAIQALRKKKNVYCILNDKKYSFKINNTNVPIDQEGCINASQILEGKWFIKAE